MPPPPTTTGASGKVDDPLPVDLNIPDNYVQHTLKNTKPRPPITLNNLLGELNYLTCSILIGTPLLGIIGACYTPLQWKTFVFSIVYYFFTGLGITAGYHRLWAHRSYNASRPLQYFLALAGAGSVQGSIKWWSRGHRAHHRYTDTELDPYNAHKGFFYSHIGWMLVKPRRRPGVADVSDLSKSDVVKWQHKFYLPLLLTMAFIVPTLIAWIGWGDAQGGYVYAGLLRLCFVHHVSPSALFLKQGKESPDDAHVSHSRPSASTRSPTGSERHLSTTSTRPATI